jgi:hypothetical protein
MAAGGAQSLEGIRGWLILVAIGLCLQPLLLLRTLVANAKLFTSDTWRVLTTPGGPAYHPFWAPLLVGEALVNLVLLVWASWLVHHFFRKRRNFPRMIIAYIAVGLAVVVGDFAATGAIPAARARMSLREATDIGRSLASAAIWIPYFLRSRRVAATFVH